MSKSMSRLCQMVHDASLRSGTKECLQVVLEAARARGLLDESFIALFDEALVGFLDKFTIVKKLAVDLDVCLQAMRPGSVMPATLTILYGDNLFDALVALRLPAVAPENVHLQVALAVQCLAKQDTIDIITHVSEQIGYKDHYVPEEEDRTVAFLDHKATLDGIVRKHVDLAANAAARHPLVVGPAY